MPHGLAEPALQPLHPDKPDPPIVKGAIEELESARWQLKNSTKTVNRPMCEVYFVHRNRRGRIFKVDCRALVSCTGRYGFSLIGLRTMTIGKLRREWEPC